MAIYATKRVGFSIVYLRKLFGASCHYVLAQPSSCTLLLFSKSFYSSTLGGGVFFALNRAIIVGMKKQTTIDDARAEVASLFGKSVSVRQNRGRNRIKYYKGVVSEIHDNVFVIALQGDLFDRLSCSYVDVVCGEIRMKPREE